MAALTFTPTGTRRQVLGDRVVVSGRFTIANVAAADEWVDTRLSWIARIVGVVAIGTASLADLPAFKRNAQGTGGTEDTAAQGGDLAVEGVAGVYEVTVIGKL